MQSANILSSVYISAPTRSEGRTRTLSQARRKQGKRMREQHGFDYSQTGQGQQVIQRRSITPPGQGTYTLRNTNVPQGNEDADDTYPPRLPTSTRRYQPGIYGHPTQVYRQGNRTFVKHNGQQPPQQSYLPPQHSPIYTDGIDGLETERPAPKPKRGHTRRFHFHPLVWLGAGMIVMFLLWVGGSNLVAYGQQTLDDWHYLRPRVFQTSAVVGASDSPSNLTYFQALNLNRHVYIFECPGGDCTKAKIINGPTLFGDGQDLLPITITFKDVNGDGKLDMEVHVGDQTFVMINDGSGNFRPLKAGEKVHM